jgi:hypothetical protein
LEDCPRKRVFSELQKQFGKENFFQIWYYMEGVLDFGASIAIPKGKYFLSRKFFLPPPKKNPQYSYANAIINT